MIVHRVDFKRVEPPSSPEPAYMSRYGGDLNAFLKWEQFGKSDESSPKYRAILRDYQRTMKRRVGAIESPFEVVMAVIK